MLEYVILYVDDLLVRIDHKNNDTKSFDESLTPDGFSNLISSYNVKLVSDNKDLTESLTMAIREHYKADESIVVEYMSLTDATEQAKQKNILVVLCCEDRGAGNIAIRNELINTGKCILFASAFIKSEHLVSIDYSKTTVGWGAGVILYKIRYFHLKDRVKVGLMLDKGYMKPGMIMITRDTDKIEYISVIFLDYPEVNL